MRLDRIKYGYENVLRRRDGGIVHIAGDRGKYSGGCAGGKGGVGGGRCTLLRLRNYGAQGIKTMQKDNCTGG